MVVRVGRVQGRVLGVVCNRTRQVVERAQVRDAPRLVRFNICCNDTLEVRVRVRVKRIVLVKEGIANGRAEIIVTRVIMIAYIITVRVGVTVTASLGISQCRKSSTVNTGCRAY